MVMLNKEYMINHMRNENGSFSFGNNNGDDLMYV